MFALARDPNPTTRRTRSPHCRSCFESLWVRGRFCGPLPLCSFCPLLRPSCELTVTRAVGAARSRAVSVVTRLAFFTSVSHAIVLPAAAIVAGVLLSVVEPWPDGLSVGLLLASLSWHGAPTIAMARGGSWSA